VSFTPTHASSESFFAAVENVPLLIHGVGESKVPAISLDKSPRAARAVWVSATAVANGS